MDAQGGGAYMAGGAYGQGQGDYGMAGGAYGKSQGMMAPGMMAPGMMAPGMAPGMAGNPMMAGKAPMTQSERIEEIEKMQIKKLKADTYKQRRKEGRPKHGTTSIVAMVLGFIALILQA